MIFKDPTILYSLLIILPLLLTFGFFRWKAKRIIANIFILNIQNLRKKHIEKYLIFGVLIILLTLICATPEIHSKTYTVPQKTGDLILLVDVSTSMAAQVDIYYPNRLERAKTIINKIINEMEELGDIRIALCGFTNKATSLVPLVNREDYSYLRYSIDKLLNINSTLGIDTGIGQPIIDVTNLPSLASTDNRSSFNRDKFIVLLSDGEVFHQITLVTSEKNNIEQAVNNAIKEQIKVLTIGIGETEGARIPIYANEFFTGKYGQWYGVDYISYFKEETLKEVAIRTGGNYFFEDNIDGFIKYLKTNLSSTQSDEGVQEVIVYHSIAHWFILTASLLWVIFVKRHLLA